MTLLEKFAAEKGVTGPFDIMSYGAGTLEVFRAREKAIHEFSFAIITDGAIQKLKEYRSSY